MTNPPELPALVSRALRKSLEVGYLHATRTETGRLLATLAAGREGTIAECGTGCGVGAAWLRSGAPARTRVLTIERQGRLAHQASDLFRDADVEVLHADWPSLVEHGPFSLLFLDAGTAAETDPGSVIALIAPGGMVVIDDFWPCESWPPMVEGKVDTVRLAWLSDRRVRASEVMVSADNAVVLAVLPRGGSSSYGAITPDRAK